MNILNIEWVKFEIIGKSIEKNQQSQKLGLWKGQ